MTMMANDGEDDVANRTPVVSIYAIDLFKTCNNVSATTNLLQVSGYM